MRSMISVLLLVAAAMAQPQPEPLLDSVLGSSGLLGGLLGSSGGSGLLSGVLGSGGAGGLLEGVLGGDGLVGGLVSGLVGPLLGGGGGSGILSSVLGGVTGNGATAGITSGVAGAAGQLVVRDLINRGLMTVKDLLKFLSNGAIKINGLIQLVRENVVSMQDIQALISAGLLPAQVGVYIQAYIGAGGM
ncbi:hypothetical protein FHG87_000240 [Trinorchestia longiramus]|nr:hypothetical protein FHG87_000240 [Trinorchestia longiramus]